MSVLEALPELVTTAIKAATRNAGEAQSLMRSLDKALEQGDLEQWIAKNGDAAEELLKTPGVRTILTRSSNENKFTNLVADAFEKGQKVDVAKLATQYGVDPKGDIYKAASDLFPKPAPRPRVPRAAGEDPNKPPRKAPDGNHPPTQPQGLPIGRASAGAPPPPPVSPQNRGIWSRLFGAIFAPPRAISETSIRHTLQELGETLPDNVIANMSDRQMAKYAEGLIDLKGARDRFRAAEAAGNGTASAAEKTAFDNASAKARDRLVKIVDDVNGPGPNTGGLLQRNVSQPWYYEFPPFVPKLLKAGAFEYLSHLKKWINYADHFGLAPGSKGSKEILNKEYDGIFKGGDVFASPLYLERFKLGALRRRGMTELGPRAEGIMAEGFLQTANDIIKKAKEYAAAKGIDYESKLKQHVENYIIRYGIRGTLQTGENFRGNQPGMQGLPQLIRRMIRGEEGDITKYKELDPAMLGRIDSEVMGFQDSFFGSVKAREYYERYRALTVWREFPQLMKDELWGVQGWRQSGPAGLFNRIRGRMTGLKYTETPDPKTGEKVFAVDPNSTGFLKRSKQAAFNVGHVASFGLFTAKARKFTLFGFPLLFGVGSLMDSGAEIAPPGAVRTTLNFVGDSVQDVGRFGVSTTLRALDATPAGSLTRVFGGDPLRSISGYLDSFYDDDHGRKDLGWIPSSPEEAAIRTKAEQLVTDQAKASKITLNDTQKKQAVDLLMQMNSLTTEVDKKLIEVLDKPTAEKYQNSQSEEERQQIIAAAAQKNPAFASFLQPKMKEMATLQGKYQAIVAPQPAPVPQPKPQPGPGPSAAPELNTQDKEKLSKVWKCLNTDEAQKIQDLRAEKDGLASRFNTTGLNDQEAARYLEIQPAITAIATAACKRQGLAL